MVSEQHRICSTTFGGEVIDSIMVGVDSNGEADYPVYIEIQNQDGEEMAIRLSISEASRFHDFLGEMISIARDNATGASPG